MVPLDIADRTGREDVEIGGRTWDGEENTLSCSGLAANKPLLRPAFPGVSCPPAIVGKYKKYFISFDPVSAGDFSFLCLLLSHIDCWLSGTLKGFLYERTWHYHNTWMATEIVTTLKCTVCLIQIHIIQQLLKYLLEVDACQFWVEKWNRHTSVKTAVPSMATSSYKNPSVVIDLPKAQCYSRNECI